VDLVSVPRYYWWLAMAKQPYERRRKIYLDPGELLPVLDEVRKQGGKVVSAGGCFELLHVGHVRYLQAARELGEVLVVMVNTDESMRKIKPDRKPVNPDQERFEIVAAIEAVTYVIPLPDLTPERLLRILRPDIHTKGTDYTLEMIPERKVVAEYGGRVAIVGDPKEHSTTRMLREIKGPGS